MLKNNSLQFSINNVRILSIYEQADNGSVDSICYSIDTNNTAKFIFEKNFLKKINERINDLNIFLDVSSVNVLDKISISSDSTTEVIILDTIVNGQIIERSLSNIKFGAVINKSLGKLNNYQHNFATNCMSTNITKINSIYYYSITLDCLAQKSNMSIDAIINSSGYLTSLIIKNNLDNHYIYLSGFGLEKRSFYKVTYYNKEKNKKNKIKIHKSKVFEIPNW